MGWIVALVFLALVGSALVTEGAWAGSAGAGGTSTVNTSSTVITNTTSTSSDPSTLYNVNYTSVYTLSSTEQDIVDGVMSQDGSPTLYTFGAARIYSYDEDWNEVETMFTAPGEYWACIYDQLDKIDIYWDGAAEAHMTSAGRGSAATWYDYTSADNPDTFTFLYNQFVSQKTTDRVVRCNVWTYNINSSVAVTTSQKVTDTVVPVSQSTDSRSVTVGDFTLGMATIVNTNTQTTRNTNTNTGTQTTYNSTCVTHTDEYVTTVKHYDAVYNSQVTCTVNLAMYVTPIVLDLSGTGVLDASGGNWLPHHGIQGNRMAMFDLNANEMEIAMEWVGPNAGLLIEPRADGSVDGSCLFGATGGFGNGFEKLRLRDRNRDRVLTGSELDGLMVWVDENGNGRMERSELRTLASLGITSISVKHKNFKSTFTMRGKTQTMWDWWPTALDVRVIKRVSALR